MWNMLVVEDEPIVRLGLRSMVDWDSLGVCWMAEASNGDEALRHLQTYDIQLVIADIRMPGMDGIELARRIRQDMPQIQMIFLSSYDDFPYVKEALRLGVTDYLHKPTMSAEEIVEAVRRAIGHLKNAARTTTDPAAEAAGGFSERERDAFLMSMLDEYTQPDNWRAAWGRYGLGEMEKMAQLVVFRLVFDRDEEPAADSKYDDSRFRSVRYLLEEYISDWGGLLFARERKEMIWLAPADTRTNNRSGDPDALPAFVETLERKVYELLQVRIVYAYSGQAADASGIPHLYLQALASFPMNKESLSAVVRAAKTYVNNHFAEDISLAKAAQFVNVSPGHLSRLFFKETGEHFSDYLIGRRLAHAKKLLRETNLKVYEISDQIGYTNPHYFGKLFKDTVGVTPLEYRNK